MNIKSVIVAALLLGAAPAHAEMTDMSVITCGDLLAMDQDRAATVLLWLDGWFSGESEITTIDTDELGSQVEGIVKICTEKPELSVMNAAREYFDE